MNARDQIGTIAFYDAVVEDIGEVSIQNILLVPGNPPKLVLPGPLFTSATIVLTPNNICLLRGLLDLCSPTE